MFDKNLHDIVTVAMMCENYQMVRDGLMEVSQYVLTSHCLGYNVSSLEVIYLDKELAELTEKTDTFELFESPFIQQKEAMTINLQSLLDSGFNTDLILRCNNGKAA